MLDAKGRDIGEPKVILRVAVESPEQIARNRIVVERTVERIYSNHYGRPLQARLVGENPSVYGGTEALREA